MITHKDTDKSKRRCARLTSDAVTTDTCHMMYDAIDETSFCAMASPLRSQRSRSSSPWLIIIILVTSIFRIADACFRRSAPAIEPVTTTTTTTTPSMDIGPVHKLKCTPEQYQQQGCLHGGKCFAIKTGNGYTLGCMCPAAWTSRRCERVYIDPKIYAVQQSNIRTANIAAGVSVCIIIALVLLVAIWVYDKYRRKAVWLHEQQFEATADDLYRRPFTGRSSIVESLTRLGSVRRPLHGETGKDPSHVTCLNDNPLCENDELQASPLVSDSNLTPLTKDAEASPLPAVPPAPRVSRFTVVTET